MLETSPDIGRLSAQADRYISVEAADGLSQKRVEFDALFRRITELPVQGPLDKIRAMQLFSSVAVSSLGEPEMAGKQSQHPKRDILRPDSSHNLADHIGVCIAPFIVEHSRVNAKTYPVAVILAGLSRLNSLAEAGGADLVGVDHLLGVDTPGDDCLPVGLESQQVVYVIALCQQHQIGV